jgi:hypothetical protein
MNLSNKNTLELIQESVRNQQNGRKVISLTDEVGNKTKYSEKQGTIAAIKNSIFNLIQGGTDYPYIYSVIQFGFYDNQGYKLPYSEIKKYWDKQEVEKTCILIYNMLKEAFGINEIWMFIERHTPLYDEEGEVVREGRFHLNIITSSIPDAAVEEPNRKCRRLFLQDGKIKGVPIRDCVYNEDLEELKIDLFDACVFQANWVNRYKYAIQTQMLYETADLENAVYYCLGDFKGRCEDKKGNKIRNEVDFMDIIVWEASDFHKEEVLPLLPKEV